MNCKSGSRKGHFLPKKANGEQNKAEGNWDACFIPGKKRGPPAWSKGSVCAFQMQRAYIRPPHAVWLLMLPMKFLPRFLILNTQWLLQGLSVPLQLANCSMFTDPHPMLSLWGLFGASHRSAVMPCLCWLGLPFWVTAF